MDHLTFDGGVGDFEKKNILQVYLHPKKQFMYMTTGEKIHACSVSQKSMLHGVKIMHTHISRRTFPNVFKG